LSKRASRPMHKRRKPKNVGTGRRTKIAVPEVLDGRLREIEYEQRVIRYTLQKICARLEVDQPAIALGKYLQDGFEERVAARFLSGSHWKTKQLAENLRSYRRKIHRCLSRINRRAMRQERVEPFAYDHGTRTWSLAVKVIDKEAVITRGRMEESDVGSPPASLQLDASRSQQER